MSEENIKLLEDLIGKEKMYNGKRIVIISYKKVGQVIAVKTSARTLTFLPSHIKDFALDLEDPKENYKPLIHKKTIIETNKSPNMLPEKSNEPKEILINGYSPSKENIKLKESLMNVLDEINQGSTDKKIKKAKSICDVANTMINIQKVEISLINAVKR